jgi:indolepyruvate ferredoxin oxidoreductase
MKLAKVSLDDKYELESGRIFLNGMQALVRLPMLQRQRDQAAGLNTAGFISGYRGSPLGNYDANLWAAKKFIEKNHIKFQPGLNEDLAVTSIWGTQQIGLWPGAQYDGVFSIWYGKGPGVDRSGDAFKHVNFAGSAKHGGVLAIAGDDHGSKSSTLPHQSEYAFMSSYMPVLNPANVQEYIDFGLYGFELSRYSGCWIGFKAVGDTVESTASVSIDPHRVKIIKPDDFNMPDEGLNIRNPDFHMDQEQRLLYQKLPAAQAFVRANGLDKMIFNSSKPRLGIITTGKAYLDVRHALDELGVTSEIADELGIRLYKVAMTWPLEPKGAVEFAKGLEEILVVEEKRPLIEDQLAKLLINEANTPRRIFGKVDEAGADILPACGELTPGTVAKAIFGRLKKFTDRPEFEQRMARLEQVEAAALGTPPGIMRTPYFCSGCPHNSSTDVPSGSRAMAGIGCHGMVLYMPARNTQTITHMGAEGVNWIGQAPFVKTKHVFQNLGDGTYFHSGLLAIRAAVDAGVNITYKILYNDAVAMTGGQPVATESNLTPDQISRQVHAEGVKKVVVVTDEPDKYPVGIDWGAETKIHHRDDLDDIQRQLRDTEGVTVLIYDQTCAAEKRRRRKRGLYPDPPKRAFINELVCEGCGDCSKASNCVSVIPSDTPFGRKRRIDQSNCNKDFSCIKGFCPSFVTVHGGLVRKAKNQDSVTANTDLFADLPIVDLPSSAEPYGVLITGIGGTGVVTIGALLGMAAHLEGKGVSVMDMTGLSQKNGAVTSHVRIADDPEDLHAVRIAAGGANLLLGCDIVVATSPDAISTVNQGRTNAVINSHVVPTAGFVQDNAIDLSGERMMRQIQDATGENHASFVNASKLATALMGDSIASNLFMVGYAWQKGMLPLSLESIEEAVRLNGVAVDANLQAMAWGRLSAHNINKVEAVASPLMIDDGSDAKLQESLTEMIDRRVDYLVAYQDAAYAAQYRVIVDRVMAAEKERTPDRDELVVAVIRNLFKLMSYKDEYEVARLHTDPAFKTALQKQFEGNYKLTYHMAPPLLAERDAVTGELKKREFGPWLGTVLSVVAKMKRFRGTGLDIFGRTAERRMERQLIADYQSMVEELAGSLNPDNHSIAVRLAELPDEIRGFGHVKEKNVKRVKSQEAGLLEKYRTVPAQATAAE